MKVMKMQRMSHWKRLKLKIKQNEEVENAENEDVEQKEEETTANNDDAENEQEAVNDDADKNENEENGADSLNVEENADKNIDANDIVPEQDDEVEEEKKEETKIVVAVSADSFIYDAETKKYTLTLKGVARVIKSDLHAKTVTIEIDEAAVNKDKSDLSETHVDEILDEIEKDENAKNDNENEED